MADYPTPPAAPKKDLPAQAKPKSLNANAVKNINSEGFSVRDLATDSSGPISNAAGVHQAINRQVNQRNATSRKLQAADEKQRSRPYTTGRKMSR